MRREILKRGRATACCKKFAKQSSLRYTKFYKAQAATVRADLQNQGAEEAAADTARRIYAAVAADTSGEISSRRASSQHIIAPKRTDRLGTLSRRAVRIGCDLRAACRVVPRHCRRIGIATGVVSAMRRARSKDSACGTARMRKRGEILKFARPDP